MPKVKISEYSATANSNTDVASINIDEGCAPSGINNAIRAVMGHLKDFQQGTNGDPFNGPVNGTLGATTAATANVTTLTTSSTVTHNGGTANGVAYLNGSKVLTTGSALVFDGTNLGLGVTPSAWPAGRPAIEIGGTTTGNLAFNGNNTNGYQIWNNSYYNGSVSVYKYNGYATNFGAGGNGSFFWNLAPSGTAGNTITFTQAMTLDASGRLVIGDTTATQKFTVVSTSGTYGTAYQPIMQIGNTSSGGTTGNPTGLGAIVWSTDGTATPTASIEAVRENPGAGAASALYFRTGSSGGGTTRAVIDSSGNLLMGTTSGISGFRLNVGSSTTTNNSAILRNDGTQTLSFSLAAAGLTSKAISATTDGRVYILSNADTLTGQYMTSGGTSWNATSDERLKENLTPITDAVNKVSTLRAVVGNYISDENKTPTPFLIAQDVQAVFPEAVDASNENELGLSYTGMIPLLVAAIKEQQDLITQLTARITALESA